MATKKQPTSSKATRPAGARARLVAGEAVRLSSLDAELLEALLAAFESTPQPMQLRAGFAAGLKNATDADLQRAAFVAHALAMALLEDNPKVWAGIRRAYDELHGSAGEQRGRARVLWVIDRYLEAREDFGTTLGPHWVIEQLATYDDRFAQLNPAKTAALLAKARPVAEVKKGGAGNVAPALTAARLSVAVAAFGDVDERKAKQAYLAALSKQSTRRKR